MTRLNVVPTLLVFVPLFTACSPEFPEYNELADFRVLALRASSPDLRPRDEVTLDALVFVPSEALDQVTYAWSWCPVRLPASEGGDCAADEREFEAALGLTAGALDFDLGSEAEARFIGPGYAELYAKACENVAGSDVNSRTFVFSCSGGFPISIRADISFDGRTIQTQKQIRIVYDETIALNENPVLGSTSYLEESAESHEFVPWGSDDHPAWKLGTRYDIRSAVDEETAEEFVPDSGASKQRRENLYISWFITTGETDSRRTTYIEGSVGIEALRENTWKLPKAKDESEREARLFLVLRDERGGVDWLERQLELVP